MDPRLRALLLHAYLFDDPSAYEAGVRDAFEALSDEPAQLEQVAA